MLKYYFVLCMIITTNAMAQYNITGGRYYLNVDGVLIDRYFTQYHTALAEAVNRVKMCGCVVRVIQPEITVSVEPTTLRVSITWDAMPEASQYQLLIDDRLLEFDASVTSFITEVTPGAQIRVRYSNAMGEIGEWSDPAIVEL